MWPPGPGLTYCGADHYVDEAFSVVHEGLSGNQPDKDDHGSYDQHGNATDHDGNWDRKCYNASRSNCVQLTLNSMNKTLANR